jgi:glycosyltransferase involved in cell wall biosynthesis
MKNISQKKLRICLLSEYAYSLLTGVGDRVGGAEMQMILLGKELVKRSYDVSFVTFQKTKNSPEMIENLKVYNPFNIKKSGYTYFYLFNLYRLFKILNHIDADIYIQRGKTPLTGLILFFTKLKNKSFIHMMSSESNASSDLTIKTFKDLKKIFYRLGVQYCDFVICQTNHQKELLARTINKTGKVIKNICDIKQKNYVRNKENTLKILWVGRLLKSKKPDLFLLLAKNIPDFKFWIIGSPSDEEPEYYREIKEDANKIHNLDFIGFVPHNEMQKYYEKTSLLINTSENEGFPNTFLEAWENAIPVVSLAFDPDEIICKYVLGFHPMTFNDLVKDIHLLVTNEKLRITMGINGKDYVIREHNITNIINEYEQIFKEIKIC